MSQFSWLWALPARALSLLGLFQHDNIPTLIVRSPSLIKYRLSVFWIYEKFTQCVATPIICFSFVLTDLTSEDERNVHGMSKTKNCTLFKIVVIKKPPIRFQFVGEIWKYRRSDGKLLLAM